MHCSAPIGLSDVWLSGDLAMALMFCTKTIQSGVYHEGTRVSALRICSLGLNRNTLQDQDNC